MLLCQNVDVLMNFVQADLNSSGMPDGPGSFYGVSSQYSSAENMTITVSTKVCSFGKQVVEKVEVRLLIGLFRFSERKKKIECTWCSHFLLTPLVFFIFFYFFYIYRQSTPGWREESAFTGSTARQCAST